MNTGARGIRERSGVLTVDMWTPSSWPGFVCQSYPIMNFELSDRCRDFQARLTAFMEERVYPAEAVYEEQLVESGDPHAQPPVMEELKEDARSRGLWNMFHPDPDHG